ncbi:GIY-YIG nuclease family protein [Marinovum sp. 2_MG-2023]|nr:GIY-YIG nuclease family protein [Marinovum sp. 2_MG-2023]MDO6778650.1 GIY-YIG nuclease family protein [Marinovum sp. 1_MG-2023]
MYLVDGSASGIVTVEIGNWSGHILFSPRTRIETALARVEVSRTGVYVLVGPDENDQGDQKIYVGEADELKSRIVNHNKEKDFWDRFVSVSSKDMNLTKAHVKYLEGRLLDFAHESGKVTVDNKTNPNFDKLPEADISDMESFLEEVRLALPVLGIDFFPTRKLASNKLEATSRVNSAVEDDVFFTLQNARAGIDARATEIDGRFVVLEGSTGSLKEKSSFLASASKVVRDRLLSSGVAADMGNGNFVLRKDTEFKSPSGAAVFLFGTSRNGRTDWFVEGKSLTYADWKDLEIAEAIGSDQ